MSSEDHVVEVLLPYIARPYDYLVSIEDGLGDSVGDLSIAWFVIINVNTIAPIKRARSSVPQPLPTAFSMRSESKGPSVHRLSLHSLNDSTENLRGILYKDSDVTEPVVVQCSSLITEGNTSCLGAE